MTTPHVPPTRAACAIILSTVITAAIFGLVIVLPAKAETPPIPAPPIASAPLHTKRAGPASSLHRPRLVGDQQTGAPGSNYGPSRERSLQGRGPDSPSSVESFRYGYKLQLD